MSEGRTTRDQLAAALWLAQPEFIVSPWDEISETTRERFRVRADALLPVVDRIAAERAAAELRAAADWLWDDTPGLTGASVELFARADALDPT